MDKWLRSDTFVKVMAVLLAVLLYIAVNDNPIGMSTTNQRTSTIIRDVGLETELESEQLAVVRMTQTVNLTLNGNAFLVDRTIAGDFRAFVNLNGLKAGVHRNVPVKVDGLPEGVDYVTDPGSVRVELEEKQQKEMEVEVELVGQPETGYTAGKPIISPTKVVVGAAQSYLDQVAYVKAVVNISGATGAVKQSVELKAYDEAGEWLRNVEITEQVAEVEVPITSPYKTVPLNPKIEALPPHGYAVDTMTPNVKEVTVFGSKPFIDELEVYSGPNIDLSDVTKDRTFETPIPLQDGVDKIDPDKVTIDVEIVAAEEKTFSGLNIGVNGKPEGWEVQFLSEDDETVTATVSGAPRRLQRTAREDVSPYIDISDLRPGEHEIEIKWHLPTYIKVTDQKKKMVRVKLID